MDDGKFISKCKQIIVAHMAEYDEVISESDIFVVWSCKTLQNNKAILSMVYKGAPLIEMTHNGDKGEIYMDVYKKELNKAVKV